MPRLFEYDEKARFNRGRELDSVYLPAYDSVYGWLKKGRIPVHRGVEVANHGNYQTVANWGVAALLWSQHVVAGQDEGWETHIMASREWFAEQVEKGRAVWREGQEHET